MKPAAIIVDTCDSDAIVPAIESCNEAGIPVFTMDRKANGGEVVSHIGYDAIKSGAMAANYLAKALSEKGKVVELQGIMGSNVAQDRHQGFTDEIKKYPNIEVVQSEAAHTYLDGGKVPKQVVLGNQVLEAKDAANYNSKRDVEIVSQE